VRALVFTGPGVVELLDVPEPEPGPGERLVHVRSAGICGSELHGVRDPGFRVPPLIMEHEFAGVIDAAGTAQTRAQSVHHQRPGGLAVWLGLAGPDPGFDAQALVRAEKRVTGSFAYTDDDFSEAAGLLDSWDLSWVISFPLAEGGRVFTSLMDGALEPVKAMLSPAAETMAR
jgi:threonine dehydrogenase-like Zn-dependent dehydrogenase